MKESTFKSNLSSDIRKTNPKVKVLAVTDKYHRGVSDLLIWYGGSSMCVELKYVDDVKGRKILKYPFTELQIRFLIDICNTGNAAFGAVGTKECIYIIPVNYLALNYGNVLKKDLSKFESIPKDGKHWKILIKKKKEGILTWVCAVTT